MELEKVLHMNGGNGEISFAQTAYCTRRVIALTKSMRDKAMARLFSEFEGFQTGLTSTLCMADLGCASGPNTLTVISELIQTSEVLKGSKEMEYQVYLNDLHGNDFNSVFMSLPKFQKELKEKCNGECYVVGLPSSFYGRISPRQTFHFVHSLYSLHWLSRVPKVEEVNKGSIYLSMRSPESVVKSYKEQFQRDFALFLRSRCEELVKGAQMVLTFMGRETQNPNHIGIGNACVWGMFDTVLNQMASEGIIEEEKLEAFNIPVYHPSSMEVKEEVEKQPSFIVNEVQLTQVSFDAQDEDGTNDTIINGSIIKKGELPARLMRSVVESLFTSHFGRSAIDEIFRRYSEVVEDVLSKHKILLTNVAISITKK